MRKNVEICMIAMMIVCIAASVALVTADDVRGEALEQDGIGYWVYNSEARINYYTDEGHRDLVIPSEITLDGIDYPVTNIAPNAFEDSRILSVTLPETLDRMGTESFKNCKYLTTVVFEGQGPDIISEDAFYGCSSLMHVDLPDGLIQIDRYAFGECRSLLEIDIPDTVKYINVSAFNGCDSIRNLEIPGEYMGEPNFLSGLSNLESITVHPDNGWYSSYDGALYNGLTTTLRYVPLGMTGTLDIPEGVTTIEDGAISVDGIERILIPSTLTEFGKYNQWNQGVTEYVVASGNQHYSSPDGMLTDADERTLLAFPAMRTGEMVIPESIERIVNQAFFGSNLDSLILDRDMTLESGAFANADGLKSVTMTSKSLTPSLFSNCSSLREVHIIDTGGTEIPEQTFEGCSSLEYVSIPDGIISIGDDAFIRCGSLRSVDLPDGLRELGIDAFRYCGITSVAIPEGVSTIPEGCFSFCGHLTTVHLPSTMTSIDDLAFYGSDAIVVVFNDSGLSISPGDTGFGGVAESALVVLPGAGSDDVAVVMDGNNGYVFTRSDGGYELSGFFGDGGDLELPSSFEMGGTVVREYALRNSLFEGNASITSVVIPGSIRTVPYQTFRDCINLESVVLMDGVEKLGTWVFAGCTSLSHVDLGSVVDIMDGDLFDDCISLESITIPRTVENYSNTSLGNAIGLKEVLVEEGHPAFVSINGAVYNTYSNSLEFFPYGISGHFSIPEGITSIFCDMNPCPNLRSIHLPSTLDHLGVNRPLRVCPSLENITVAEGNGHFRSVDGVLFSADGSTLILYPQGRDGTYTIPDGVTAVGDDAFYNNPGLTSVTFPDSLRSIGDRSFSGCTSLVSVTIPSGLESVGESAFSNCVNLGSATVLGNDTSFNRTSFSDCHDPLWVYSYRDPGFLGDDESIIYQRIGDTAEITLVTKEGIVVREMPVGAPFDVSAPVTEGYTIVGWDPSLPSTVPSEDTVFTAIYEVNEYQVTFTVDGDVYDVVTVEFGSEIPVPTDPSVQGKEFSHWKGLPITMPARDLMTEAVWITPSVPSGGTVAVPGDSDTVSFVPGSSSDTHTVSGITEIPGSSPVSWNVVVPSGSLSAGRVAYVSVTPVEGSYPYDVVLSIDIVQDGSPIASSGQVDVTLSYRIPAGIADTTVWMVGEDRTLDSVLDGDSVSFSIPGSGIVAIGYETDYESRSPLEQFSFLIVAIILVVAVLVVALFLIRRRKKKD